MVAGDITLNYGIINKVLESDSRTCMNPDFFGVKVKMDGRNFIDYYWRLLEKLFKIYRRLPIFARPRTSHSTKNRLSGILV